MKYLARSGGVVETEENGMLSEEVDGSLRSTRMDIVGTNLRKRSADGQIFERLDEDAIRTPAKLQHSFNRKLRSPVKDGQEELGSDEIPMSDRRRALFEPLGPTRPQGSRSGESLLPPPDFESATYPRGWAVGKKRKLVNVDVVESMRRVAVLEMNRKDREIDGLNEQLEEDARCLEHLQLQLLQERSKSADVERENDSLRNQISLLMDMVQENEDEESVDVA